MKTGDMEGNNYDTLKLLAQKSILKDAAKSYPGRTIENIIANLDARIKAREAIRKAEMEAGDGAAENGEEGGEHGV